MDQMASTEEEEGWWPPNPRLSEGQIRSMLQEKARKALKRAVEEAEWQRYWRHARTCSLSQLSQDYLADRFVEGLKGLRPGMPEEWYSAWGFRIPKTLLQDGRRKSARLRCKYRLCREGHRGRRKTAMYFDREDTPTDPYCSPKCLSKQKSRYGWFYRRTKDSSLQKIEKRICTKPDCIAEFYPPPPEHGGLKVTRCGPHRFYRPRSPM